LHSALHVKAGTVKLLLQAGAVVGNGTSTADAGNSCADAVVVARELKLYR
jgi:hypothetical protein